MIGWLVRRNLVHHWRLLAGMTAGIATVELLLVLAAARIELGPGFVALFEQFVPAPAREILFSQFGLVSIAGAVAFGFQHPAILVASFAFVVVVGTIPAAERESGFLDLVLSRPVPRGTYLLAVVVPIALGALLMPAAQLLGARIGLSIVEVPGELPWTRYALPAADLATLLLAIGGASLAFASGNPRRGPAVARVAGLAVALFVVEILADLWEPLARIRWLSPFHYFKPVTAAVTGHTPWHHPAVLLGIFAAGVVIALARFRRQDL